jgi:tetratricopeptide (TPR) repeat protein
MPVKNYFMRLVFIVVIIILCSVPATAQQNENAVKLVKEGIALHDKGEYDAAIKKYNEALLIDKNDYDANYEKSLSCLYSKDYDDCIAISKYLIEKHAGNEALPGVYSNYGSALDDKGEGEAAIRIFDEGIKKFPQAYLIHFNKGLACGRLEKWDEAVVCFFDAMKIKPTHAGSLYYTSLSLDKSNKVAALISGLAFLAAEPEGKRAETIYKHVNDLMGSFAQKNKDGKSVISITAGDLDNKKKENNFSMVQMMLGLTAASSLADSVRGKTAVEELNLYLQMMASSLSTGIKDGKGIYWELYAPFWVEMNKKEMIPVYAHIASITSGNEENIKWISDNQDKLKAFYEWYNAYQWPAAK